MVWDLSQTNSFSLDTLACGQMTQLGVVNLHPWKVSLFTCQRVLTFTSMWTELLNSTLSWLKVLSYLHLKQIRITKDISTLDTSSSTMLIWKSVLRSSHTLPSSPSRCTVTSHHHTCPSSVTSVSLSSTVLLICMASRESQHGLFSTRLSSQEPPQSSLAKLSTG